MPRKKESPAAALDRVLGTYGYHLFIEGGKRPRGSTQPRCRTCGLTEKTVPHQHPAMVQPDAKKAIKKKAIKKKAKKVAKKKATKKVMRRKGAPPQNDLASVEVDVQRRPSGAKILLVPCPTCHGDGEVEFSSMQQVGDLIDFLLPEK